MITFADATWRVHLPSRVVPVGTAPPAFNFESARLLACTAPLNWTLWPIRKDPTSLSSCSTSCHLVALFDSSWGMLQGYPPCRARDLVGPLLGPVLPSGAPLFASGCREAARPYSADLTSSVYLPVPRGAVLPVEVAELGLSSAVMTSVSFRRCGLDVLLACARVSRRRFLIVAAGLAAFAEQRSSDLVGPAARSGDARWRPRLLIWILQTP